MFSTIHEPTFYTNEYSTHFRTKLNLKSFNQNKFVLKHRFLILKTVQMCITINETHLSYIDK